MKRVLLMTLFVDALCSLPRLVHYRGEYTSLYIPFVPFNN